MKRIFIPAAALLLTFCASQVPMQSEPAPPPDWRSRVTAAKAIEDPARRSEAMLALLREALPGREVRLSADGGGEHVVPDENQPAPIINFDPRLNQKRSAVSRSGTSRSLENNFGYYFSIGGSGYVVLGPAALDPRSPVLTRLAAEHELFHATNHVGDPRPLVDRELETWSHMFIRFFHDVYQFRQRWAPMLSYYDNAGTDEKKRAIDRLLTYYRNAGSTIRSEIDEWITRRKADTPASRLIADLETAIDSTDWRKRVTEAQALEDETKRGEAMLALVREALSPLDVRASGNAHPDQVHPEDNQPAPVVNFDVRMNEKTTYATNGRLLETSPAYYFPSRGKGYVVLGPRALDPRSPVFTRMQAEHELFHARHHVGDPRPSNDRELEAWAHLFVTYFDEIHPFKQRWAPLVSAYEQADRGEQRAALEKLVSYYKAAQQTERSAFDEWLARRRKDERTSSSKLVADLDKALRPEPNRAQ